MWQTEPINTICEGADFMYNGLQEIESSEYKQHLRVPNIMELTETGKRVAEKIQSCVRWRLLAEGHVDFFTLNGNGRKKLEGSSQLNSGILLFAVASLKPEELKLSFSALATRFRVTKPVAVRIRAAAHYNQHIKRDLSQQLTPLTPEEFLELYGWNDSPMGTLDALRTNDLNEFEKLEMPGTETKISFEELFPMHDHFTFGDTQIRYGDPLDFLDWFAKEIIETTPSHLNMLGDWWDLCSIGYDEGKLSGAGTFLQDDIDYANMAMSRFMRPIVEYIRVAPKDDIRSQKLRAMKKNFFMGNHEYRLNRIQNDRPALSKSVGAERDFNLEQYGWDVYAFLTPKVIDGIIYAHYLANSQSGRPVGGAILGRFKHSKGSFIVGHQQYFMYAEEVGTMGNKYQGIVAGQCNLVDEEYRGQQANGEWRGACRLLGVANGNFDLQQLSLEYLCKKYEGMPLWQFMEKNYPEGFKKSTWMNSQKEFFEKNAILRAAGYSV